MGKKIFNQTESLASNNITIIVFGLDRSRVDKSSDENAKNQSKPLLSSMPPLSIFFVFSHDLIEFILNLPIEFMPNKLNNICIGQNKHFLHLLTGRF